MIGYSRCAIFFPCLYNFNDKTNIIYLAVKRHRQKDKDCRFGCVVMMRKKNEKNKRIFIERVDIICLSR
jgi:hypothetical protein